MAHWLARRWFLLVLLSGIALALLWPPSAVWTVALAPHCIIVPSLFLMSLGMPSRQLRQALRAPWAALWAVVISYAVVPLLALGLSACDPIPDYRMGLLIVASVPCTLSSAVLWTRLARGDDATALLVIVLTTSSSWLVTTLLVLATTQVQIDLDPRAMIQELLLTTLLPVVLGQLCQLLPKLAALTAAYKQQLSIAAQLLVVLMILRGAYMVGLQLRAQPLTSIWLPTLWAICAPVLVHLGGLQIGYTTGRWLGCARARCVAIAFAGSQKTLPVALLLYEAFFKQDFPLAILPIAVYHIGQLVLDTFIAERMSRKYDSEQGANGSAVVA